jgi:alkanesulfonate monooxygenase SsuD/methylene tetrahydromethanopterin reductase-like flavin-dependent oxidoreductase (luciferase family)
MLLSAKLAPTVDYPVLEGFWRAADELGFHSVANYDHFYGLIDNAAPTLEAWTSLAAMAAVVRRARVSCLVSGVNYRNPAVLAKMAGTWCCRSTNRRRPQQLARCAQHIQ